MKKTICAIDIANNIFTSEEQSKTIKVKSKIVTYFKLDLWNYNVDGVEVSKCLLMIDDFSIFYFLFWAKRQLDYLRLVYNICSLHMWHQIPISFYFFFQK